MFNAILEVKAQAERELLFAQAKLDVVNEIIAKFSVDNVDSETETVDTPETITTSTLTY